MDKSRGRETPYQELIYTQQTLKKTRNKLGDSGGPIGRGNHQNSLNDSIDYPIIRGNAGTDLM